MTLLGRVESISEPERLDNANGCNFGGYVRKAQRMGAHQGVLKIIKREPNITPSEKMYTTKESQLQKGESTLIPGVV